MTLPAIGLFLVLFLVSYIAIRSAVTGVWRYVTGIRAGREPGGAPYMLAGLFLNALGGLAVGAWAIAVAVFRLYVELLVPLAGALLMGIGALIVRKASRDGRIRMLGAASAPGSSRPRPSG